MLIALTLMQSALARTHTHSDWSTVSIRVTQQTRLYTIFPYTPSHTHTHESKYVYKNWISGVRGSRSTRVFTSDGIQSLEASCMTQMFVGFGSRCCCASRGVLCNIEALFLNKNREICISQTSWSVAGSWLSIGPDAVDGQDKEEDIIEMGS